MPAALLEALLAERRGAAAAAAYRRALELSERAGFADHASFALSGLGSVAFANANFDEAEAQYRRALAVADAASASWLVAHVKARLAQVGGAVGDAESAATLYRSVVAWSREPRRHDAREALFIALVGSPATAALVGLAELGDARGDGAAADELRARGRARSRLSAGQRRVASPLQCESAHLLAHAGRAVAAPGPGHGSCVAAALASVAGKRRLLIAQGVISGD